VLLLLAVSACNPLPHNAAHSLLHQATADAVWTDCGDGFQCATLSVPIDYSNPSSRQISLALIRKQATGPSRRIGSLLMNPGGPGGSGVDFLRNSAGDFANLNKSFDLLSWDPRGVGASAPISCLDGPELDSLLALDPVLDDPQEKQTYIQGQKDFVSGCWRRNQDLLPFLDSKSTARDLDRIRAAVGDPKLSYIGFSYGTFIAQWYAHQFPTRVRAMVLDGVVLNDVSAPSPFGLIGEAESLEGSLRAYAGGCAARSTCPYRDSGNPEARIEQTIGRLDAKPVAVGSRKLTRGLGLAAIFGAMYDAGSWPDLDRALASLDAGDGSQMLVFADTFNERYDDGTYASAVNGALDATDCIDAPRPTSDISQYDQLGPILVKASPVFGPMVQYSALHCAFWPVDGRPERPNIENAPPLLLIGATGDPVTPYVWAKEMNSRIPGSVLLTRQGNGHTSYGIIECIDSATDNYLTNLVLPPQGMTCIS
jgi:pimeloyl-ACP methyl ester carboxylesterase